MADVDRISLSVLYSSTVTPPVGEPIVTDVSPTYGPTTGGTEVTITGTDLTPASGVKFGTSEADSFIDDLSGTTIVAVTPAHVAGIVTVVVEV